MSASLLLRTPPPYEDESLAGYLIRLTQSNYYSSPNWILRLAGLQVSKGITLWAQPPIPSPLSQLIKLTDEQLKLMASLPHQLGKEVNPVRYIIYKYARKLCPNCLLESAYCRKIWDWKLVGVCSLHQCLLITSCAGCQKNIRWARATVTRCRCGFDFRNQSSESASLEQINLSVYLSKLGNYISSTQLESAIVVKENVHSILS
jgi:hypothetical protein